MPDWISEIKSEMEQSNSQREAGSARAALAAKILMVDGPKFWDSLVARL